MQNVKKTMRSNETPHWTHCAVGPAFSYDVGKISEGCLVKLIFTARYVCMDVCLSKWHTE